MNANGTTDDIAYDSYAIFVTFNSIFSQFLGFMVPLIIVGLVAPAIADIGNGAGKLLIVTVLIAYADTILAGLLSYGVGSYFFPSMISGVGGLASVAKPENLAPFFEVKILPQNARGYDLFEPSTTWLLKGHKM